MERKARKILPLLLGLLLVAAKGNAQGTPAPETLAEESSLPPIPAAPASSPVVAPVLKACPIALEAVKTTLGYSVASYSTRALQQTVGPSLCSLLGIESFEGDKSFVLNYQGSSYSSGPQLSSVHVFLGDVVVEFEASTNMLLHSIDVKYRAIAAKKAYQASRISSTSFSFTVSNLTTHALANQTGEAATQIPAAGRRLQQAATSRGAGRRLLDSGDTDNVCITSKALTKQLANETNSLGPLCPAAALDRAGVAKRVMQACAAALAKCADPQPLEAADCSAMRNICNIRLAQLVVCADARRLEDALKAGDRKQLGCDEQGRDPLYSKGCAGKVFYVENESEADLASMHNITVEELQAANVGRKIANETTICIPGRRLECGQSLVTTLDRLTAVFTVPVEGKQSATVTWASGSSGSYYTSEKVVNVRDQQSGTILYSSGPLKSNATKTVNLPQGTREVAVLLRPAGSSSSSSNDPTWSVSVTCA